MCFDDVPTEKIFNIKVTFETAKGDRTCRNSHKIQPGRWHLALYGEDRPDNRTNYCLDCATDKLKAIQTALNEGSNSLKIINNHLKELL